MRVRLFTLWLIAAAVTMLASVVRADEGMWLFERPPTKILKERYGFEPTPQWLEHVQRSCVKFGDGGSGSLVSPRGLVMTNHHVGSDDIEKLSTAEHNYLRDGFLAQTLAEELPCKDLELRILWTVEDVTDRVSGAAKPDASAAELGAAQRGAIAAIEKECEDATKLDCNVVKLYHGARYHLYRYKRFTDVRLVMAPEQSIAFFGGDTDNFEYPRYNLDVSFFRIYENGEPLKNEHYLKWSASGPKEGDLVFLTGHPARTQRLFTMDHLAFLRDTAYPEILRRLWRREVQLQTFSGRSAENARVATGELHGIENSRKAFTGMMGGLLDPQLLASKQKSEKDLRAQVAANPEYKQKWGDAWDRVAAAQASYREIFPRYSAIDGRREVIRSDLYRIARHIVLLTEERTKPNEERWEEYSDASLDSLLVKIYAEATIYDALERDAIASGLSFFAESFGADDPLVRAVLAGKSPRSRADELVRGTRLKDIAYRKQLVDGGTAALAACDDPLIKLAQVISPELRKLRKRYQDEVESVEREAYARIAAAQFAIQGDNVAPDATFSLRIAFGTVIGYEDEGQRIPAFTDYAGLYERFRQREGKPPFNLSQRWIDAEKKLNLKEMFNYISTTDCIGGNSGSPTINREGEVVGIVFDGNIPGLVWDTVFTQVQGRSVHVDSRAIIEALKKVYAADALAGEIQGK